VKCLARHLPPCLQRPLFGDRAQFGLMPNETDPCWTEWQKRYLDFYLSTQKTGLGKYINDLGYRVLSDIDLSNKVICEIGPGTIPHLRFWQGKPARYIAVDIDEQFIHATRDKVQQAVGCDFKGVKISRDHYQLDLPDQSIDILLSFYSFEHLYPLESYLREYRRVLKPNGLIVGAVPNEGGFLWGLGRFLTSRRWIHRHTTINYDKIICWEHPNFVDTIINQLDHDFERVSLSMAPLSCVPLADMSLVTRFVYRMKD
jgi:SAM-dependent methyltransferase